MPPELTLIDCVVAPVDQRYDEPALAFSVTEPPGQNDVAPFGVIVACAGVFTVTVALPDDVPLQFASLSEVMV